MLMMIAGLAAATAPENSLAIAPKAPVEISSVDPAAVDAALRLLDARNYDRQSLASALMLSNIMISGLADGFQRQYGKPMPPDLLALLHKEFDRQLTSTLKVELPSIRRQCAEIYARHFTRAEIEHLIELEHDPVAVKAQAMGVQLSGEFAAVGVRAMRRHSAEIDGAVKSLVEEYLKSHKDGAASGS